MTTLSCRAEHERTSPRAQRAVKRLRDIQEAACRLVIDRGYDGFTMDELATVVGVSRRTLFNYVPDKASAVVGTFTAEEDQELLAAFRDGGPTGELLPDLHHAIDVVLDDADAFDDKSQETHQLVEAAIAADPKVLAIVTDRFEQVTALLERAVIEREGWPDADLRARALAATTLALIKLTLDEIGAHATTFADFKTHFHAVLAADAAVRAL